LTRYNVFVAVALLTLVFTQQFSICRTCSAADAPRRWHFQPCNGSEESFELRAFAAEADYWDGRASLEVHLPFDWCLATEIAPQTASGLVATAAQPAEISKADAYRAILAEVAADRPLTIPPATTTYRATEADILNVRVPTKISTTYADWLLTNGILVPKLNTPGQGVDLGYNLQLQRWY
jgi:hypothetical protein